MVAAAPNLTRVSGSVVRRVAHPTLPPGWDLVTLDVHDLEPVTGPAGMVRAAPGGAPLEVAVLHELVGDAEPGTRLTMRVRMTTGGPVAEKQPAPGDFVVEPPDS